MWKVGDMRLQGPGEVASCCSHSCLVAAKPFPLFVYGLLSLGLSFPIYIVKELDHELRSSYT